MTEKRAKEILDFLAKRSGCWYMSMRNISEAGEEFNMMSFIPYIEDQKIASPIWVDFKDLSRDKMIEYKTRPSWRRVLKDLLNYASDIDVKKISNGFRDTFMAHGECLEKILVEMDLVEETCFNDKAI